MNACSIKLLFLETKGENSVIKPDTGSWACDNFQSANQRTQARARWWQHMQCHYTYFSNGLIINKYSCCFGISLIWMRNDERWINITTKIVAVMFPVVFAFWDSHFNICHGDYWIRLAEAPPISCTVRWTDDTSHRLQTFRAQMSVSEICTAVAVQGLRLGSWRTKYGC